MRPFSCYIQLFFQMVVVYILILWMLEFEPMWVFRLAFLVSGCFTALVIWADSKS